MLNFVENGIDVSHYQGTINWKKVKLDGTDFAIIKCLQGKNIVDECFHENMRNAIDNGVLVGAYVYSKAKDVSDAVAEAKRAIKECSKYDLTYPIVFDFESKHFESMSKSVRGEIINAFCSTIEQKDIFKPMLYSSRYWLNNMIPSECVKRWDVWLAEYTDIPKYKGEYKIWQYGVGSVNGIAGLVDKNYSYYDFRKDTNMNEVIFNRNDYNANSSNDVKALQSFLNTMHYTDADGKKLIEDGKYGKKTDYAFGKFIGNHKSFGANIPIKTDVKLTIDNASFTGTVYKVK